MKRSVFAILILLFFHYSYSQDSEANRIRFKSINEVGVATGAQRDAVIIHTTNGVSYKSWSAGIGVGIDAYGERSIPLFIDLRKSFGRRNNIPFVYADGGINFGWLNFIQRENNSFPDYKQPSKYFDGGIGWKIPLSNRTGFLFSAGYSIKHLKGNRTAYGPMAGGRLNEYSEEFENTYRRIVIKIGVEL